MTSETGGQSIRGNRNVQIQDVDRSLIEITYNETPRTVPLEPAHVPVSPRLPSPARLVRAHAGIVPYVDRGGLLTDLESWIETDAPFAGQIIGGRGGSGKTRLAVEICQVLRERDWLCGFLSRIADPAMLDALVQAPTARLVVVDYAESRVEQLELLLPLLKASATSREPVRVLLLTRTGPSQERSWSERLRNRIDTLDAVLDECDERTLEETPLEAGDRTSLFDEAAAAFAARTDPPPAPPPAPSLDEEVFSSPLMVVIAAYLAVHGESAPPSTRTELLDEVLAHERRYWRDSSSGLDTDEVLLSRMVALATLVSAETEAQAADLLRLLPDLEDAPAERRSRLARWVREQYPGPRWWNPLEPDLVGEHLVVGAFVSQPEVLRRVLAGTDPEAITRPLEVLSRAAADHPDLNAAIGPILSSALDHLCKVAVTQAETVKDRDLLYGNAVTAAGALAAALSGVKVDTGAVAAGLARLPPRPNVVLNELAVILSALYAEGCLHAKHPLAYAGAMNNLSNRLADVGRQEEALQAIEIAVQIRRDLTAADAVAHGPDLARTLHNLSNRLSTLGRRDEALAASEESVAIRRPLAEADPGAYDLPLASALNGLCNCLADLGRYERALEASEESAQIYRRLAKTDSAEFGPDLAMALNNLSNRLGEAGRPEEALLMIEESADAYRQLAAAKPAVFGPDLANVLNNLSGRLVLAERQEEALVAIQQSVEILRSLAAANPAAYEAALASALNNLSNRLADSGLQEEAMEAIEEAVNIYRPLAADNPAAYGPDCAISTRNLWQRLTEQGRSDEAKRVREELDRLLPAPTSENAVGRSGALPSAGGDQGVGAAAGEAEALEAHGGGEEGEGEQADRQG